MLLQAMKRTLGLALSAAMILSAAGCGQSAPTPAVSAGEQSAGANTSAVTAGGQVVIARQEDSINLDPVIQDSTVSIWMIGFVMEGLVQTSDDGKSVEPGLAESWDISDDQLTYTFHIREGLKFSDGSPVTKEDWLWSLDRSMHEEGSPWLGILEVIDTVEAPDDATVIIKLKEPWAPILADLALFNATLGSKAYFEKVGAEQYSQGPIGTGPFRFSEWKKGEYLLLEKNEHYRVADQPKVDSVKFTVVPDDNTRVMQLQAGEVDAITQVPWNRMEELSKDPGLNVNPFPASEVRYLAMNNTSEKFKDVHVRRAVNMAIDKDAIIKTVLYGYGMPANSYMPNSMMYYDETVSSGTFDLAKAKEELAQSPYPTGFEATLLVPTGNTLYQSIATMVKEQLKEIGVMVNIEQMESGTLFEKRNRLDYELAMGGWSNDISDPSQQADYAFLSNMGNSFATGYYDAATEAMAVEAKRETDPEKRGAIYKELQRIYAEEAPLVPLYYAPYPVAMSKKLSGFVQNPMGAYRFANLTKN